MLHVGSRLELICKRAQFYAQISSVGLFASTRKKRIQSKVETNKKKKKMKKHSTYDCHCQSERRVTFVSLSARPILFSPNVSSRLFKKRAVSLTFVSVSIHLHACPLPCHRQDVQLGPVRLSSYFKKVLVKCPNTIFYSRSF